MGETKFTPGPWYVPHFADDTVACDCKSIVSECYAGAICTIAIDNGLRIEDGGNDAPPIEEAKANARLIAAAPDLFTAGANVMDYATLDDMLSDPSKHDNAAFGIRLGDLRALRAALSRATEREAG